MTAVATEKMLTLKEVLGYCHPGVLRRYAKEHDASPEEAEEVFWEMLKFLYLSYRAATNGPDQFACAVSAEIEKIDWMWHTFLLFTLDYGEFCDRYFGFFLHHVPNEDEEGKEEEVDEDVVRGEIQRQLGFVYDVLGEKTLTTWYDKCRYAAKAPAISV